MISICVKPHWISCWFEWAQISGATVRGGLGWFRLPRTLALRLKTAAIQHRWFKNKWSSPSAERFRMIPSAVNSSFASVTTLERKEERRVGGARDRPSDKYTAGDICEQPSEWEKQSDTSTVSKWHLISVDSSSWTRGDLWRGRKAQRQCQIDVMIIHILPSAHFRSAKDKLKEKYRCLTSSTTLKLSFFQVNRH